MNPYDFNVDNNNNYDPDEEAARIEWGPVFDSMMAINYAEPEDVHAVLRDMTDEELGIPVEVDEDKLRYNAVYLLVRRLLSRMSLVDPDTLTTEAFDILLDRYPAMFTTFRNNAQRQSIFSRIFSKVIFEAPEHELYTIVPEKVLGFVKYLKSRGANPGCAFTMDAIVQNYSRPLIEYLARNYGEDFVCALDNLYRANQITRERYEELGRLNAQFRRRHALAAFGRTRRNKSGRRRNKSRRLVR